MLETAEVGHTVSKREFERAELQLREALVNAQYDLLQGGRKAVVVLFVRRGRGRPWRDGDAVVGVDGPGANCAAAFGPRTPGELAHPWAGVALFGRLLPRAASRCS